MKAKKYWKLYNQLPEELQDLLASNELVEGLEDICEKHDITQYLYEMNDYVGDVLLGVLSPEKFEQTIKKELKLKKEKAKEITKEVNRNVFYPVKSSLEDLHNIEIAPAAKMKRKAPASKRTQEEIDKTKEATKKDTYREPIEEE